MSTGFQITHFNSQQFWIALIKKALNVFNLEVKKNRCPYGREIQNYKGYSPQACTGTNAT